MQAKRLLFSLFVVFFFLFSLLALSACNPAPESEGPGITGTVTPTPTMDPSGYQAIPPEACIIRQWSSIQAERRTSGQTYWSQGDLLAFQPAIPGQPVRITYLAPSDRSSWLTGDLRMAEGPDFKNHVTIAPNVLSTGDITWSPSGAWLAFTAFRSEDSLHTVLLVEPDGSGLTDLFPADQARTDNRSSQKAIIGWEDDQTLQVIASCGDECRQAFDIDVSQPNRPILVPTPIANYKELSEKLKITRHELPTPTGEPLQFPKYMGSPHWSPDERQLVYLDKRALLWYLSIDRKINYLLDIGLRDVQETRWSPNSDYLAVRAEDQVFLFEIPCKTGL